MKSGITDYLVLRYGQNRHAGKLAGPLHGAPCASPHALVAGKSGARLEVEVEHFQGHAHLPIIRLRRAA
jgi:hypothetical protein